MRTSRTARRAALATAALALGLGVAAPAHAEVEKRSDPAKDVVKIRSDGGGSSSTRPARSNKTADVTRFTTRHGRKVVLTTTLRKLDRTAGQTFFYSVLKTPREEYIAYAAIAGKGGDIVVFDADEPLRHGLRTPSSVAGEQPSCPGARVQVTGKKTFRTTIPRSCLGAPTWVRTGAGVSVATDRAYFADDAGRTGIDDPSRPPKLGKKVRRG